MKLLFSLSVLLSLASSNLVTAGRSSSKKNTRAADEERKNYIVKVKDLHAHRRLSKTNSHEILHVFKHGDLLEMRLDKAEVRELMISDDVLIIEEDKPVHLSPTYRSSQGDIDASIGASSDAEVPYGITMVQALDVPDNKVDSSGMTVCIADTGYDKDQKDLPQGIKVVGKSFIKKEKWDEDGDGHGTHVAGTIAALKDDIGVLGVVRNGQMKLLIAKVLSNEGSGSWAGVLAGIEWCQENGANVISMSLGGGGFSQIASDIYREIYENDGVLIVAAAGNSGPGQVGYPASYDSVLSVGAIDSNKNIASFSQTNDQIELVAPGVAVKSTLPNDSYAAWSGTSMACPHVAGVAALVWSHFPYLTAMEIRNVLRVTAENLGNDEGKDRVFGYGLVSAKAAFDALVDNDTYSYFPTASPTECDGVYLTVTVLTDNWGYEVSWEVTNDGLVILSSDGETYGSNQQYVSSTCVPAEYDDGDYISSIFDSYGDGLVSPGFYKVTIGGDIKAEGGGNYGSKDSKVFSGTCGMYPPSPSAAPPTKPPKPTKAPKA